MKRRVGTHVEEDDRSWDSAINLMLEIEGVSTNLISHAYFPFISSNAAWGYNTITKSIDTLSSESEKLSYNAVLREGLLRSLRKLSSAFLLHFGPPSTTADPEPSNSASSLGIGSLLGSFGLGAIRPNAGGTVTGMTASTLNGNTSATSRFNFTQRAMSTAARPITSFGSSLRSNLPSAIPSRDIEDQFMFQMLKSLTALGHSVTFPGKLGYRVSQYHVSFHIPLQRVISKFFKYACLSGLDVSDALRYLKYEAPPIFVNSIADFPLRCLSLISQVSVGMWKRNGISVSNVAYNYNRPIFSKTFRYADLHSIQIAMVVLGEDSVLALALDRFELLNFLEADSDLSLTSEQYVEFKGPLLAEFLKFLSNLILYVPAIVTSNWEVNISKDDVETLPKAVARELVHHVFVGDTRRGDGFTQVIKPASFSSMLRVKNVVATSKHVTESLIRSVSANYCTQKQGNADEEESAGYDLSEKGFQLIDLEYGCWSPEEQQRAAEKVKDIHKKLFDKQAGIGKLKSSKPFFRPVISFDAIPNAHPAFVSVRKALYRPLTFSILEKSLVLCELKVNREGLLRKCFTAILCRVVHVVTLQIICLDTFGSGSESGSSYSDQFYNNSFRPSSGEGYKLLIALGQLWNAKLLKDEEVYLSGLGWILSHLYTRSADAKSVLEEKGISFSDSADQKQEAQEAGSKSALAKKKAAAQQRALAAMSKQAMSFSATMDEDDDDVDESKNDSMKNVSNIESIKGTLSLEDGASDCIMCRDRNGGTIGYLCYLQPSSTLSNAIKQCPSDDVVNSIKQVYRVVSLGGCQVHSRGNETSPVVSQLNYGDHIRAKQRVGIWLEIVAPIHGWVAYYSPNPKHNAGLPSAVTFPYIVQLHRVLDLTFHKHGPARIHGTIPIHIVTLNYIYNKLILFFNSVDLWTCDAHYLLECADS